MRVACLCLWFWVLFEGNGHVLLGRGAHFIHLQIFFSVLYDENISPLILASFFTFFTFFAFFFLARASFNVCACLSVFPHGVFYVRMASLHLCGSLFFSFSFNTHLVMVSHPSGEEEKPPFSCHLNGSQREINLESADHLQNGAFCFGFCFLSFFLVVVPINIISKLLFLVSICFCEYILCPLFSCLFL